MEELLKAQKAKGWGIACNDVMIMLYDTDIEEIRWPHIQHLLLRF